LTATELILNLRPVLVARGGRAAKNYCFMSLFPASVVSAKHRASVMDGTKSAVVGIALSCPRVSFDSLEPCATDSRHTCCFQRCKSATPGGRLPPASVAGPRSFFDGAIMPQKTGTTAKAASYARAPSPFPQALAVAPRFSLYCLADAVHLPRSLLRAARRALHPRSRQWDS